MQPLLDLRQIAFTKQHIVMTCFKIQPLLLLRSPYLKYQKGKFAASVAKQITHLYLIKFVQTVHLWLKLMIRTMYYHWKEKKLSIIVKPKLIDFVFYNVVFLGVLYVRQYSNGLLEHYPVSVGYYRFFIFFLEYVKISDLFDCIS